MLRTSVFGGACVALYRSLAVLEFEIFILPWNFRIVPELEEAEVLRRSQKRDRTREYDSLIL